MRIEKGDTVLYIVYHAPSLKGFDIGKITSKEDIHKKKFYEIDGGHFGALYPHTPLFYEAISVQYAFIKSMT